MSRIGATPQNLEKYENKILQGALREPAFTLE